VSKHKGQTARILRRLIATDGWVPAPELSRESLQYCARVHELRAVGFVIENRIERRAGIVHGFYRLKRGVGPTIKPEEPQQLREPGFEAENLNYPD
jgi:hypothetical protein